MTALILRPGLTARLELGRTADKLSPAASAHTSTDALHSQHDVSLLLHVSDMHFGAEDPPALEALLALALHHRPQAVVTTGDITQHAQPEEFAAAAQFFARLAARHPLVLPGNHDLPVADLPRRLVAPYSALRNAFGDELEPRLQSRSLWLAGLRTTRRWRHREGTLSAAQVVQTAQWLTTAPPAALRVVAMHHPLAVAPGHDGGDEPDVLRNADFAIDTWAVRVCIWCSVGTATCPACCPCLARHPEHPGLHADGRHRCGRCKPALRCRSTCAATRRTRSTCCAGWVLRAGAGNKGPMPPRRVNLSCATG